MKSAYCIGNCASSSIRELISEHFSIIIAAGIVGALFGLFSGGIIWTPVGAICGIVLAIAYGYIPRIADCVGECPVR